MTKIYFFITLIALAPGFAQAQFVGLVQIPGVKTGNFDEFVNALYLTSISVAALMAVVKIIIAGAKYMMSDVITNKQSAKEDIKWSLLGLLLIMAAVIILELINPNLTKAKLGFREVPAKPVAPAPIVTAPNSPPVAPPAQPGGAAPAPAPAPGGGATPSPAPKQPVSPTPKPVVTPPKTTCNPAITSSVSGTNTVFRQDLTGCASKDASTYRQTMRDFCQSYNVFATGNGTISSCTVPTSKIK